MGAVAGVWHLDERPVSQETMHRLQQPLAWFGPDRSGTWRDGARGLLALQQPFTPEDRHDRQPLAPESAPFALVALARLDNRDELCHEFGIPPAARSTTPDSVLLLRAYERWGEACPQHLLGAFSFVIWDDRQHHLFGARDIEGSYPLFYAHQPGRLFAFATDPRALHALPEVPRALDQLSLAQQLVGPLRQGATLYEGIRQLPAAHRFTLTQDRLTLKRYWQPGAGQRPIRYSRTEDYVEDFRERFDEAVRCRLRSIHPIASHLSGGLDSSSVAAVAAEQLAARNDRLMAYALRPLPGYRSGQQRPNFNSDDSAYAEAAAQQYPNIDLHFIEAASRTPLTHLDRTFSWGATQSTAFNRIWWEAILEDAAQRGCGVLLTGQGGNLTVSSWGKDYLAELLLEGQWRALWNELGMLRAETGSSFARLLKSRLLRYLAPDMLTNARAVRNREQTLANRMIDTDFAEATGLLQRLRPFGTAPEYRVYTRPRRTAERIIAGAGQRGSALHAFRNGLGVDLRDPTADRRIIDFCWSIPLSQFASGGRERLLIRRAMEGRLPPELLARTDRGSQAADWPARLEAARPEIERELDRLAEVDLARRALDLPRMRSTLATFSVEATPTDELLPYQWLLDALFTGRFIRLFEKTSLLSPCRPGATSTS